MYNRMKNVICLLVAFAVLPAAKAQTVAARLSAVFAAFENDPQLKNGLASLCVIDGKTGAVVFEKNAATGLAPASTQKILTAAAAYELLGKDFRFVTRFGYAGPLQNGMPQGGLVIQPSGDPTLGSWRWKQTAEDAVMKRLLVALQQNGVGSFSQIVLDERGWEAGSIPGGWLWDDIGNYYGAGAGALNWRENQYDLLLKAGPAVGDPVAVAGTRPKLYGVSFESQVTAAANGSGDNSYIYLPVGGTVAQVRGTIPAGEDRFVISGALPLPETQFLSTLQDSLQQNRVAESWKTVLVNKFTKEKLPASVNWFHTEESPGLDSVVYWFLKRSINLYGEALAKTMARQQGKTASSENGAAVVRTYWSQKIGGLNATELNLQDGSGLSPQNRVTTHAQTAVLYYAQQQPWFEGFYDALPLFNGMKLKSGTIGGVKGFCGYHTSKSGKQYIVSFLVNNYNGRAATLVQKMYKVLDVLK